VIQSLAPPSGLVSLGFDLEEWVEPNPESIRSGRGVVISTGVEVGPGELNELALSVVYHSGRQIRDPMFGMNGDGTA